jgi:hypothetical protein
MKKPTLAQPSFKRGEHVVWRATGKIGIVRHQFSDGYVMLEVSGRPAELSASSLERVARSSRKKARVLA